MLQDSDMRLLSSLFRWFCGWIVFVVGAPLILLCGLVLAPERFFRVVQVWSRALLRVLSIRVVLHGEFPRRETGAFVAVAPHVNLFDPFVMASILPRPIAGVELDKHFRWPLYGRIIARVGNIPLSHTTPQRTRESLRLVEERLKKGQPLVVFPEGHRTRTGRRGEFGSWIFRVAARTGTPVVPIAFRGAWERNHVGSLLITPGTWEVEILPPIIPVGGDRAAAEALKKAVEEAIDTKTQ